MAFPSLPEHPRGNYATSLAPLGDPRFAAEPYHPPESALASRNVMVSSSSPTAQSPSSDLQPPAAELERQREARSSLEWLRQGYSSQTMDSGLVPDSPGSNNAEYEHQGSEEELLYVRNRRK